MKKILLFLITICAFASMNTAKAQSCTINIANVGITKTWGPQDTLGGTNCTYKFNASFDIKANNGFKYMFFHSWRTNGGYVPSFDCSGGNQNASDIPTVATLGTAINDPNKSFMDFGFLNIPAVAGI